VHRGTGARIPISPSRTRALSHKTLKENWSWYQMGPGFVNYEYRYGAQKGFAPYAPGGVGAESALQLETELNYVGLQPRYVVPAGLWIDPSVANQYSLQQTNIGNYVDQWTAQFINGSKSLDTDWTTFVQGVQKSRLDPVHPDGAGRDG